MSNAPHGSQVSPKSGASREDLAPTADAIFIDFRRLVRLLSETIEMVEASDAELAKQLSNTKLVAERGQRLGRLLVRMTRAE